MLDMKRLGVDESKGKVDVYPIAKGNLLRFYVTTRALIVLALVVANSTCISYSLQ
jgi:hypothetical protein